MFYDSKRIRDGAQAAFDIHQQASSPTNLLEEMERIFGPIPLPLDDDDESDPFEEAEAEIEAEAVARLAFFVAQLNGAIDASGVSRNCECPHCGEHKLIIRRGRKQLLLWCEGCKVPSQFLLECLTHNCGIRLDRPEPLPEPPQDVVDTLSPKARLIFFAFVAQARRSPADANGHYCFMYDRISKELRIRRNDIKGYLDELEAAGLLVITRVFGRNVPGKPRLNYYGLPHLPGLNTEKPARRGPAPERTMHTNDLVTINESARANTPIKHHTSPARIVASNQSQNVDHVPPSPAVEEPPPEGFGGVLKARSKPTDEKRRRPAEVRFVAEDDCYAFAANEWEAKARRREAWVEAGGVQ